MNLGNSEMEILKLGEVDWVPAAAVYRVLRRRSGIESDPELKLLSVRAIRKLLDLRLVTVGRPRRTSDPRYAEEPFESWEISNDEAIARILQRWDKLDRPPYTGEVCWLDLTKEGERMAASIPDDIIPDPLEE